MSYQISSIEYVSGGPLIMSVPNLQKHRESGPESALSVAHPVPELTGFVRLTRMRWSGEGSGHCPIEPMLQDTKGHADLVICWEGGDSYEGLRVRNGVVTKHKVVRTLGEEVT